MYMHVCTVVCNICTMLNHKTTLPSTNRKHSPRTEISTFSVAMPTSQETKPLSCLCAVMVSPNREEIPSESGKMGLVEPTHGMSRVSPSYATREGGGGRIMRSTFEAVPA